MSVVSSSSLAVPLTTWVLLSRFFAISGEDVTSFLTLRMTILMLFSSNVNTLCSLFTLWSLLLRSICCSRLVLASLFHRFYRYQIILADDSLRKNRCASRNLLTDERKADDICGNLENISLTFSLSELWLINQPIWSVSVANLSTLVLLWISFNVHLMKININVGSDEIIKSRC